MKYLSQDRISTREVAALIGFYFVFSFLYHLVLVYLTGDDLNGLIADLFSPSSYWRHAGLQYVQYFLLSAVVWALVLRPLRRRPQWVAMIAVALVIAPGIYLMRELRYAYLDGLDRWHLKGTSSVWDLYIPALFLLFQFGCYFAYVNFRENERKLRVEGELRQAALKSELAAIKAQLNPHFLYNVFNSINASLPPGSEATREMVSSLADLFRYQLRAAREEVVPLAEELAFVRGYLELEHARFGDRLRVDINVAADILDRPVPPMILQPLVENSIKHGLASLVEGGTISLDIFAEGDCLHFRIADDGVGIADKDQLFGAGVGLTNTKLRLEKMYGSVLEVLDNAPRGLVIQFSL